MPSPFPGMDPYLEDPAYWQDFHRSFITYCRDALLDRLPEGYEARIDEQVRLVEHGGEPVAVTRLPDVAVTRDDRAAHRAGTSSQSVATLEPVAIPMLAQVEEVRDTWIEIVHRPDRSLVTVIEILSPSNKAGIGYHEYRQKRFGILQNGAHLVELDLLLGGRRLELLKPLPKGDYYGYVTREQGPRGGAFIVDVYAWGLRDPLPTVPVPLRAPDPDVGLDIAAVFAITYERGRYARSLRYDAAPPAPLDAEGVEWARERAAQIRK
jgi:hypothetical protein